MVEMFGINTFSARYALATYGGAERLAYEMTEDERMDQLGPIWGQTTTVCCHNFPIPTCWLNLIAIYQARFNDTLREILAAEVVDL